MIGLEKFPEISKKMAANAIVKHPAAQAYLQKSTLKDDYLGGCLLSAVRGERRFQINIVEGISSGEAFFKATGFEFESRLLTIIYSEDNVDYMAAAALLEDWIINLQSEEWLVVRYKSLF